MQKRIFYHIAFWTGYVLFKTFLNISPNTGGTYTFTLPELGLALAAQLALLLAKIPMVYTLFYIAELYLSKRWNILKTIFAAVILFALSLTIYLPVKQYLVVGAIYKIQTTLAAALNFNSILSSLFVLFITCSFAMTIKFVRATIRQKEAEKEIIKKKLETELQFLKAQTNPHFLFNTLNNIYALARKKSDQTAEVVMKLSKLLRFMLYESQKKTILIAEEIQVLDDYIELEKIRYNEKLNLTFTKAIDNDSQSIAPLILLPFVENAFKHGASESRFGSYITIDLKLMNGELKFSIENSRANSLVSAQIEKIGLTNVRRQLELLYPEHTLEIENESNRFKVILKLNFKKNAKV